MTTKIHTAFDPPPDVVLTEFDASKTRQEFLEESDINNIIDQYQTNGILPETKPEGLYGDFTDPVLLDFQHAQNLVVGAREAFDRLPAKIRDRFQNDPVALIAFVQDEGNRDEAIRLGIIPEPVAPAAAEPATPVPPKVNQ